MDDEQGTGAPVHRPRRVRVRAETPMQVFNFECWHASTTGSYHADMQDATAISVSRMACLRGAAAVQDVGAADQLFATLDTKIRRAQIGGGESVLLVDTVGFIQGLPLSLVAAFQATLDEATQAHLLVRSLSSWTPHCSHIAALVLRCHSTDCA